MFLCYIEPEDDMEELEEYACTTVFWDGDNNLITTIHENDGDWRTEYMNKIVNHFGIEVTRVKKLPAEIKKQLI